MFKKLFVLLALLSLLAGCISQPTATPAATATTVPTETAIQMPTMTVKPTNTATPVAATPILKATPTATTVVPVTGAGWKTEGNKILDPQGQEFKIRGLSWYGMETESMRPGGLDQRKPEDILNQAKDWGFNLIRFPFSGDCVKDEACMKIMDQMVDLSGKGDMFTILDYHRINQHAQSKRWYTPDYTEENWIQDLKTVASRYANNPTVIGVELFNEPYSENNDNVCWGCGGKDDWQAAATKAGNAVMEANPQILVFVQGIDQYQGDWYWRGGNLLGLVSKPVELKVPDKVVYLIHDYPASVYKQGWFSAADYPNNLPQIWDHFWGQFADKYPIAVGEFGTKYQDSSDKQWLQALVKYAAEKPLVGFIFWDLNPESGDTGGLLKSDWKTPEQEKLDILQPLLKP